MVSTNTVFIFWRRRQSYSVPPAPTCTRNAIHQRQRGGGEASYLVVKQINTQIDPSPGVSPPYSLALYPQGLSRIVGLFFIPKIGLYGGCMKMDWDHLPIWFCLSFPIPFFILSIYEGVLALAAQNDPWRKRVKASANILCITQQYKEISYTKVCFDLPSDTVQEDMYKCSFVEWSKDKRSNDATTWL